jgi:hypothetical protein
VNAKKLSMFVACVAAAAGLTACERNVTSSAAVVPETVTPISRSYVVESSEVVEIGQFVDGSVKYSPTGWIVVSPSTSATATGAALRQEGLR